VPPNPENYFTISSTIPRIEELRPDARVKLAYTNLRTRRNYDETIEADVTGIQIITPAPRDVALSGDAFENSWIGRVFIFIGISIFVVMMRGFALRVFFGG
jgi:hypothetical protein